MIAIYTETEMLDKWRLHRHLCPPRADASVERTDFLDTDAVMLGEMREWYRGVLESAPLNMVGLTDYASRLTPLSHGDGVFEVMLPPEVVRVAEVMLSGWHRPAQIVAADSPEASAQLNPFSRGGVYAPVAVMYNRRLMLYSLEGATQATLVRLTAVADDGSYRLDEALIGSMKYEV